LQKGENVALSVIRVCFVRYCRIRPVYSGVGINLEQE